MGTISVTNISDGTTGDAADVNSQINTIVSEFNGNIDNANIKALAAISGSKLADASITNAKLSTGVGEPGGAWNTWTPTLSGRFTDGDWTKECKYKVVGKLVYYIFSIKSADATPMAGGVANAIFTLPVTAAAIPGTDARQVIGSGYITDDSAVGTICQAMYGSTTTGVVYSLQVTAANVGIAAITSTSPQTWTTNDEISIIGFYEAA